jgi:hypothetical protein
MSADIELDQISRVVFRAMVRWFLPHFVPVATLGHTPTAHFKAMFTGYEEVEEEPVHTAPN